MRVLEFLEGTSHKQSTHCYSSHTVCHWNNPMSRSKKGHSHTTNYSTVRTAVATIAISSRHMWDSRHFHSPSWATDTIYFDSCMGAFCFVSANQIPRQKKTVHSDNWLDWDSETPSITSYNCDRQRSTRYDFILRGRFLRQETMSGERYDHGQSHMSKTSPEEDAWQKFQVPFAWQKEKQVV